MHDSFFAKEEVYTRTREEARVEVYVGTRTEARMEDSKLAEALLQNLSKEEQEYRQAILEAIERKVSSEGFHRAVSHPERARQFMPFAALKGYEEMVSQQEVINNERVDC